MIRTRSGQRGAAVFIVLLVITLLTAVGIFAARSATLVDQAAGHDRKLVQTQYLTEYAGRSVAAELGDGAGKTYLDKVKSGTDTCQQNLNLTPLLTGANLPCYKLYMSEISDRTYAKSGTTLLEDQSATAGGSLGPPVGAAGLTSATEGVFVVEVTDPFESVPNPGSEAAGLGANAFRDVQITLTAYGQVRPVDTTTTGADPWCAANASSTSASIAGLRSHVTLKNIPR